MKLNFILDLDQTIISSEKLSDIKHIKHIKHPERKKNLIQIDNNTYTYHLLDQYIIIERPGLQHFLDYLFENFDVSVWTAATKDYAKFVCKNIILGDNPERKLKYFLHFDHCKLSTGREIIKNLQYLYKHIDTNFNKNNTILLDDSVDHINYNNEINAENIIQAKEYFFLDKEQDTFLEDLVEQLKNQLKYENVTTIVKNINTHFNVRKN